MKCGCKDEWGGRPKGKPYEHAPRARFGQRADCDSLQTKCQQTGKQLQTRYTHKRAPHMRKHPNCNGAGVHVAMCRIPRPPPPAHPGLTRTHKEEPKCAGGLVGGNPRHASPPKLSPGALPIKTLHASQRARSRRTATFAPLAGRPCPAMLKARMWTMFPAYNSDADA